MVRSLQALGLALVLSLASAAGATSVRDVEAGPMGLLQPDAMGSGSLAAALALLESHQRVHRDPMRIWNRLTPSVRVDSDVAVDPKLFLFEPDVGSSTTRILHQVSLVDAVALAEWDGRQRSGWR